MNEVRVHIKFKVFFTFYIALLWYAIIAAVKWSDNIEAEKAYTKSFKMKNGLLIFVYWIKIKV